MIVSSKAEELRIGTRQVVEKQAEPSLAYLLSRMSYPDFPEPIGVFRSVEQPAHGDLLTQQVSDCIRTRGEGRLEDLFDDGETYEILDYRLEFVGVCPQCRALAPPKGDEARRREGD